MHNLQTALQINSALTQLIFLC